MSTDLKQYMTENAQWYWFTIALCGLTAAAILFLPQTIPWVSVRFLLGSIFVLWMPGYCIVRSIFVGRSPERLELIALSLGTSIMSVPMIAFILHYTPWGIKTASVTVALLILTLASSTLAVFREHQLSKRKSYA